MTSYCRPECSSRRETVVMIPPKLPLDGPEPRLPRDAKAQSLGRLGEAVVTERFEEHGWIVLRNRPNPDFGVDLAAFKRSEGRFVLPYALSVQVKTTNRAHHVRSGGVSVQVRSSTLASWLWSNTPTVCVVYELSTGQLWWSVPVVSPAAELDRGTKSRALRLDASLDTEQDWSRLSATVAELWSHHEGARVIMDVPLVLQVLTDIALHTDLWTTAGGTSDAVYHAAAVFAYRIVAALNALAGRTGSDDFVALPDTVANQRGMSWNQCLVSRGETTLGVVSGIELRAWSTDLLQIFGQSGHELAATVPRLQQLARMPELGIPSDLGGMLAAITRHQLAIIDPHAASELSSDDFAQIPDRPTEQFPAVPELDNRVRRPLAQVTPGAPRTRSGAPSARLHPDDV